MSTWSDDELRRIAEVDDLHIAPYREDNVTYGTPTWIWSVVVNGALYARAYNGTASSWYKAALRQKAGRITVAGMKRAVTFEAAAAALAPDTELRSNDDKYEGGRITSSRCGPPSSSLPA